MDKTIDSIKLTTTKDKHGSFYDIIFENQRGSVYFTDAKAKTQRFIFQLFPAGVENLAEIFAAITEFEFWCPYFDEDSNNEDNNT